MSKGSIYYGIFFNKRRGVYFKQNLWGDIYWRAAAIGGQRLFLLQHVHMIVDQFQVPVPVLVCAKK